MSVGNRKISNVNFLTEENWIQNIKQSSDINFVLFVKKDEKICKDSIKLLEEYFISLSIDNLNFYLLDVYESTQVSLQYRVSIVPHLIGFRWGYKFYEKFGLPNKAQLVNLASVIQGSN